MEEFLLRRIFRLVKYEERSKFKFKSALFAAIAICSSRSITLLQSSSYLILPLFRSFYVTFSGSWFKVQCTESEWVWLLHSNVIILLGLSVVVCVCAVFLFVVVFDCFSFSRTLFWVVLVFVVVLFGRAFCFFFSRRAHCVYRPGDMVTFCPIGIDTFCSIDSFMFAPRKLHEILFVRLQTLHESRIVSVSPINRTIYIHV